MSGVARPIVKWVGGKSRLMAELLPRLPAGAERMRHVEPFLGGGAMFFARAPERALLCDVNADLVAMYDAVREDVAAVQVVLAGLAVRHAEDGPGTYAAVRAAFNRRGAMRFERAAQLLYLNKTCFNGLWRVNRRGDFNVPIGSYARPAILDVEALEAAAAALRRAELRCQPFERLLDEVGAGDFVYLDPPYDPLSATSSFTAYAAGGFGQGDQARLAGLFDELAARGIPSLLSNSDTPLVRRLYRRHRIETVVAPRAVSASRSGRASVREVLVANYDPPRHQTALDLTGEGEG